MESTNPYRWFILKVLLMTQLSFGVELHEESEGRPNFCSLGGRNYFKNLMSAVLSLILTLTHWHSHYCTEIHGPQFGLGPVLEFL